MTPGSWRQPEVPPLRRLPTLGGPCCRSGYDQEVWHCFQLHFADWCVTKPHRGCYRCMRAAYVPPRRPASPGSCPDPEQAGAVREVVVCPACSIQVSVRSPALVRLHRPMAAGRTAGPVASRSAPLRVDGANLRCRRSGAPFSRLSGVSHRTPHEERTNMNSTPSGTAFSSALPVSPSREPLPVAHQVRRRPRKPLRQQPPRPARPHRPLLPHPRPRPSPRAADTRTERTAPTAFTARPTARRRSASS